MDNWTYAILDIGAAGTALAVGYWRHQRWLRHWRQSFAAIGAVALAFVMWDVAVTKLGHWSFNPAYVLGWGLGGLPLEELVFFIAIPLVCLAVWELVTGGSMAVPGDDHTNEIWSERRAFWYLALPVAGALGLMAAHGGRGYSWAAGGSALAVAAWAYLRANHSSGAHINGRHWLIFQLVMVVIFFAANSVLTGRPVVLYNPASFSGWRIGTVPVEDFLYNFALTNAVILARWYGPARRTGVRPVG